MCWFFSTLFESLPSAYSRLFTVFFFIWSWNKFTSLHFPFTCAHRSNARKLLFILIYSIVVLLLCLCRFIIRRFSYFNFQIPRHTKESIINLWLLLTFSTLFIFFSGIMIRLNNWTSIWTKKNIYHCRLYTTTPFFMGNWFDSNW